MLTPIWSVAVLNGYVSTGSCKATQQRKLLNPSHLCLLARLCAESLYCDTPVLLLLACYASDRFLSFILVPSFRPWYLQQQLKARQLHLW